MSQSMMLISADLSHPGQDYTKLYEAIDSLPGALRYQQSSWIVRWSGTSLELRDLLRTYVSENDKIMVARIANVAFYDSDLLWKLSANGYPIYAA